jgi:hypothetical protein
MNYSALSNTTSFFPVFDFFDLYQIIKNIIGLPNLTAKIKFIRYLPQVKLTIYDVKKGYFLKVLINGEDIFMKHTQNFFGIILIFILTIPTISVLAQNEVLNTNTEYGSNISVYLGDPDDLALKDAFNTFTHFFSGNYALINSISFFLNTSGIIVIFAHGNETGIFLQNNYVLWNEFAIQLEKTSATSIYIMSCYSNNIKIFLPSFIANKVIGIDSKVDAISAGFIALLNISPIIQLPIITFFFLLHLLKLQNNIVKPVYLYYASPYPYAYRGEHKVIIDWFSTQITNVLWYSMDAQTCSTFLLLVSMNGVLWSTVISLLPGIGAVLGSVLQIVLGIAIAIYSYIISQTQNSTPDHHCVWGIGAEIFPAIIFQMWFDFGSRQEGYGLPITDVLNVGLFHAYIGAQPTSWTRLYGI